MMRNVRRHNRVTAWVFSPHSAEVIYSECSGQMWELTCLVHRQMAGAEGSHMHPEKRHSVQDQAEPRGNQRLCSLRIEMKRKFKGSHCLKRSISPFQADSQELLYANTVLNLASWLILQHSPITHTRTHSLILPLGERKKRIIRMKRTYMFDTFSPH